VAVGGKGPVWYNSSASHCCCSAEISVEFVALERWQSFQPGACRYKEWKWVSKAVLDRCQSHEQLSAMVLVSPGM